MNKRAITKMALLAALVAALPACEAVSGFFAGGSRKGGPADINDLLVSIEQVYVNAELSKDASQEALHALRTVANGDFNGDSVAAYQELVGKVEASEEQADELRQSVTPMKRNAVPIFERWAKDLGNISNPSLRQRSQSRLTAARQRYESIVAAVDPAQSAYDAFNRGLQDHVLFLGNDLNPAALADVQHEVKTLSGLARELEQGLDSTMVTTRAYVDAASLPGNEPPRAVAVSDTSESAAQPKPSARKPD